MRQHADAAVAGRLAAIPGVHRATRWLAALCLIVSSEGCILTKDLPDPALDIPEGYKAARLTRADAPPTLDWWRGFRSRELTSLMEEAQTVNLDIAAATARFIQADAQARVTGAALLPSLSGTGQQTYSRSSGSSSLSTRQNPLGSSVRMKVLDRITVLGWSHCERTHRKSVKLSPYKSAIIASSRQRSRRRSWSVIAHHCVHGFRDRCWYFRAMSNH